MSKKHLKQIERLIRDQGGTDIYLKQGGKHPKFFFNHGGKKHMLVSSYSPSDHRTIQQTQSTLRKIISEV